VNKFIQFLEHYKYQFSNKFISARNSELIRKLHHFFFNLRNFGVFTFILIHPLFEIYNFRSAFFFYFLGQDSASINSISNKIEV